MASPGGKGCCGCPSVGPGGAGPAPRQGCNPHKPWSGGIRRRPCGLRELLRDAANRPQRLASALELIRQGVDEIGGIVCNQFSSLVRHQPYHWSPPTAFDATGFRRFIVAGGPRRYPRRCPRADVGREHGHALFGGRHVSKCFDGKAHGIAPCVVGDFGHLFFLQLGHEPPTPAGDGRGQPGIVAVLGQCSVEEAERLT